LIAVLVAVGLTGCSRSVEEREPEDAEAAQTPESGDRSGGEVVAPGETVVSAVTPPPQTPGAETQVTPGTEGETTTPGGGETPTAPEAGTTPEAGDTSPALPSEPQTPAESGDTVWHIVQPGETLSSIAQRYGTTSQAIAQANGITNPSQIYQGQKLKIPTSEGSSGTSSGGSTGCRVRHTVRPGEWVWQIARNYGVSPYDILAVNGMTIQSARIIHPGTVLCIP
jgi:LysM repeat protein